MTTSDRKKIVIAALITAFLVGLTFDWALLADWR